MRIGIDISQLAYEHTGVASYLSSLVRELVKNEQHEYALFFASLRKSLPVEFESAIQGNNVRIRKIKLSPTVLDLFWNRLHIAPIEWFIGDVDVFITSDWTEPPVKKAKKATIIYDLIIYKHPEETDKKIIQTQKRKLKWVKKESDIVFCISESTKNDAIEVLGLDKNKVKVIYPGASADNELKG